MLQEGTRHAVTVEGYSSEGHGVARIDGQVVFVKGALAGERCDVCIEHVGHRAAWAAVVERSTASPHRVTPRCPYVGPCGGCQLQHMDYAEELAFKADKVTQALRRIGAIDVAAVPIHAAPTPERYRNKVQLPVGPGGRIGYYAPRSHRVVDVDDCRLAPAACTQARAALRDYLTRFHVPAYDEHSGTGLVRHLFVRVNAAGQALVCVLVNGETLPHEDALVHLLREQVDGLAGAVLGVNRRRDNVILGDRYRTLWGCDHLTERLCGLDFQLSVPAFFQVNRAQAEVLYALAGECAGLTGRETLLDLYCGTGTIGLSMAAHAARLIGVEVVPAAVADARENARRNGISNARFLCADAGEAAGQLSAEGLHPDVVVVDPPRKGLAPAVVQLLREMAPARIVYVSCDPATLARDLKSLCRDYTPTRIEAVDLFPRTHHVESVVLLSKVQK